MVQRNIIYGAMQHEINLKKTTYRSALLLHIRRCDPISILLVKKGASGARDAPPMRAMERRYVSQGKAGRTSKAAPYRPPLAEHVGLC